MKSNWLTPSCYWFVISCATITTIWAPTPPCLFLLKCLWGFQHALFSGLILVQWLKISFLPFLALQQPFFHISHTFSSCSSSSVLARKMMDIFPFSLVDNRYLAVASYVYVWTLTYSNLPHNFINLE